MPPMRLLRAIANVSGGDTDSLLLRAITGPASGGEKWAGKRAPCRGSK